MVNDDKGAGSTAKGGYRPSGRDRAGLAARQVAATILENVLHEKRNFDGVVDDRYGFANYRALIAKDRALARMIAATVLRRLGQVDDAIDRVSHTPLPAKAAKVRHILRAAIGQILFMEVPDSAAVNLAVTAISEDRKARHYKGFANAVLRRIAREKAEILAAQTPWRLNMPDWLHDELMAAYGAEMTEEIGAMHLLPPSLDFTVKSDPEKWAGLLDAAVLANGTLRRVQPARISALPGFQDGEWWIQDAAATLPVRLIGDVAGAKVLDLCAAPGGKTAQLVTAGASVTAVEISEHRATRLRENLTRLRLDAELIRADLFAWDDRRLFDAVLLDAPCSSTGTIRRHPDIARTKNLDEVATLAGLQLRMLRKAAQFVRPGGMLVFANCSILPREGEDICQIFVGEQGRLRSDPVLKSEFSFAPELITADGYLRTLPNMMAREPAQSGGLDGFFAARFIALGR